MDGLVRIALYLFFLLALAVGWHFLKEKLGKLFKILLVIIALALTALIVIPHFTDGVPVSVHITGWLQRIFQK